MYIVIRWDGIREVGVNADGTYEHSLGNAELYDCSVFAQEVADIHGGDVYTEERIFA